MKNIVICSDGTGNSAIKGRGTNVFKLYEALDLNGHRQPGSNLRPQVAFYDDGVGTETLRVLRILGGAFGWGLSRNVKQLYAELCRCYEPGDRIYLFGFSRGAFTVRTLAGLIVDCGIIDPDNWKTDGELDALVEKAYERHREHYQAWIPMLLDMCKRAKPAGDFQQRFGVKDDTHAPNGKVPIHFMGVWDTVDAVGFPVPGIAKIWNQAIYRFKFPNNKLDPLVKKACQALAIDDQRRTFKPELWDETDMTGDRIEQVWFSGVHSNVGGGYPKHGMSLVTLNWMMTKAEQANLRFLKPARDHIAEQQNADDKLYDSRRGLAIYYGYKPRVIGDLCEEKSTTPKVHVSAIRRISKATEGYAPDNLPASMRIVPTDPNAPLVGEDPVTLSRIEKGICAAIQRHSATFAGAAKWVRLRQVAQVGFWVLSGAVLLWAHLGNGDTAGGASGGLAHALPWPIDWVLNPIMTEPELAILLLAIAASLYGLAWLGRTKLEQLYSGFWREALPKPWSW